MKILDFKEKMQNVKENGFLKSGGEELEIEDAKWNIEATLNYTYGDASTKFPDYHNSTTTIEIPKTNNKIAMDDVIEAYDNVKAILIEQQSQIESDNKQLILVDLNLDEETETTATFIVISSFGTGSQSGFNDDFGPNDYWSWGWGHVELGGYCDGPFFGQDIWNDAATKISYKVNNLRIIPGPYTYISDPVFLEFTTLIPDCVTLQDDFDEWDYCDDPLINPNDDVPEDNIRDFIVFYTYNGWPNYNYCVPPDDMNYYLGRMRYMVYTKAFEWFPEQLEDKWFVNMSLLGDMIGVYSDYYHFHQGVAEFGYYHIKETGPAHLE